MGSQDNRDSEDIVFVFPHIHHDRNWDVSHCQRLWTLFVANNIVEPLVRLDDSSNFQGALADSWAFSSDKKTLSFIVGKGNKFHDGSLISAEDVANSIKSIVDGGASHGDLRDLLCDDKGACRIDVKDHLVTLHFSKVTNGVLVNFATPEFGIVPKIYHETRKNDDKSALKNLSGPYQVTSFSADAITLKAFANHPLITEKSPKTARIKEITDPREARKYLMTNPNAVLVASDYSSGLAFSDLDLPKFVSIPALTEFFLPNHLSPNMNSLEKRRKIFSLLRRIKEKITIDKSISDFAYQIFPNNSNASVKEALVREQYLQDMETPKPLMSLKVLLFDWMKESPIPAEFKRVGKDFGLDIQIDVVPISELVNILKSKDHDLIYVYSGTSAKDPIVELVYLFQHPLSAFGSVAPDLQERLEKIRNEEDEGRYNQALKDIHLELISRQLIFPVLHSRMMYVSGGTNLLPKMNLFDGGLDIWKWERAQK